MTNPDDPEKSANPEEARDQATDRSTSSSKAATTTTEGDGTSSANQTTSAAAASSSNDDDKMEVGSPAKIPALDSSSGESTPAPVQPTERSVETAGSAAKTNSAAAADRPSVDFKVIFNKKKYDVSLPLDTDIGSLKTHLQPVIEIPPAMMKVMIKGLAKDHDTLAQLGVNKGSKIMVVGSKLDDVYKVSTKPDPKKAAGGSGGGADKDEEESSSESQKTKLHKKVLDKGKPEDAMPGLKGVNQPLPPTPIAGMLNKNGAKVRLTFKMSEDQVWIGTKDRTQKLPMNSIRNVLSEPIEGHDEYHIVALQLGATEASRYWIYWVPAQYVESIKDAILGKWTFH